MNKKNVGIIGVRGMVGSVLFQLMQEHNDWHFFQPHFFSTSQQGQRAPLEMFFQDANDLAQLSKMDILLSTQGGDYTQKIFPQLRSHGWKGDWIDAASPLRLNSDSVLLLDPVNGEQIAQAKKMGVKNFIGSNCTVSLMLLALHGLIKRDLVEWVSSMTYQAASGAGANHMRELLQQLNFLNKDLPLDDKSYSSLDLEKKIVEISRSPQLPQDHFKAILGLNLLPFIDSEWNQGDVPGQSKEEWKGMVEANKILGKNPGQLKVDGTCVRVGSLRCHSQGLTVKLKKSVPMDEVQAFLKDSHSYLHFVPNNKDASLRELNPMFISGTEKIAIGRVRPMTLGKEFLNVFTVGDQLLWGAATPLRRMLRFLCTEEF